MDVESSGECLNLEVYYGVSNDDFHLNMKQCCNLKFFFFMENSKFGIYIFLKLFILIEDIFINMEDIKMIELVKDFSNNEVSFAPSFVTFEDL